MKNKKTKCLSFAPQLKKPGIPADQEVHEAVKKIMPRLLERDLSIKEINILSYHIGRHSKCRDYVIGQIETDGLLHEAMSKPLTEREIKKLFPSKKDREFLRKLDLKKRKEKLR